MPRNKRETIFSVKKIHTNIPDTAEVNESLDTIYRNDDGIQIDTSKLVRSKGRGILFMINWLFVIAIIVFGGFFSYRYIHERFFTTEEGSLELVIDVPSSVASGEELSFEIVYTNKFSIRLREVELSLRVPDTFIISETVPKSSDDDSRLWKISSVEPGKTEKITVTGAFIGEIGSNHILQTFISYEPENFSSRFEEQASALIQISSGNIITKKKFPAQAVAGETVSYTVQLFASEKFDKNKIVRVTPIFPSTFILAEAGNTPFVSNSQYWEVIGLTTEEDSPVNQDAIPSITFSGIYSDGNQSEGKIILEYSVRAQDENYYLEKIDDFVTKLIDGEFIVSLILNGEAETKAVNIGEVLLYTLTYKNQSDSEANEVIFSMDFPLGLFDYDSLSSDPIGKREGDRLVWTSENIKTLEKLPSGEGGQIDLTIALKEKLPDDSQTSFTSQVDAYIKGFGELETELIVKSNEINSQINSDLDWYSSARYYNDDDIAIGTGPMPPQVGKPTTLHVIWRLNNSSHKINALEVTGKLPSLVKWTGKTNLNKGVVTYNDTSRTITWKIDEIEKNSGVVEADFEISITPTFDELNTIILLMPAAKLIGLDQYTDGQIDITGKALTTDLDDDPVLSGRGLVEN